MSQIQYRLTTVDNPYNPFTNFNEWFMYDVEKGYNTCGYLARITNQIPLLIGEDEESESRTQRAIDEIIKYDFMNIYRRVKEPGTSKQNTPS